MMREAPTSLKNSVVTLKSVSSENLGRTFELSSYKEPILLPHFPEGSLAMTLTIADYPVRYMAVFGLETNEKLILSRPSKPKNSDVYFKRRITIDRSRGLPFVHTPHNLLVVAELFPQEQGILRIWELAVSAYRDNCWLTCQLTTEIACSIFSDALHCVYLEKVWPAALRLLRSCFTKAIKQLPTKPLFEGNRVFCEKLVRQTGQSGYVLWWNEAFGKGLIKIPAGKAFVFWNRIECNKTEFPRLIAGQEITYKKLRLGKSLPVALGVKAT